MSNWKLQGEIERLLKRVIEGNQEFDNTWEKVEKAPSANLKEKYESELKREIKKLQRYRDQIKTWIASNDVKNKEELMDSRKSIERQMERFKVLERKSKTKTYSKEGLAKLYAQQLKADPREESYRWISETMGTLQDQIVELEEEMESVTAKSKRKSQKQRLDDISEKVNRHNWHISELRKMKKRLEDEEITIRQGKRVREDVEWYIESYDEPEFVFDDTLYDAIDEEDTEEEENEKGEETEEDEAAVEIPLPTNKSEAVSEVSSIKSSSVKSINGRNSTASKSSGKREIKRSAAVRPAGKSAPAATVKKPMLPPTNPWPLKSSKGNTMPRPRISTAAAAASRTPKQSPVSAKGKTLGHSTTTVPIVRSQSLPSNTWGQAAKRSGKPSQLSSIDTKGKATLEATAVSGGAPWGQAAKKQAWIDGKDIATVLSAPFENRNGENSPTSRTSNTRNPSASTTPQSSPLPDPESVLPTVVNRSRTQPEVSPDKGRSEAERVKLGKLMYERSVPLNVIKNEPRSVQPNYVENLSLLASSMGFMPNEFDTDRPKQYVPRNPYRTPASFPKKPPPIFESPEIFRKFSTDTLFFIFYFQQGTQHQYLAARELKRLSWRYHKHHLTWFQRFDAPKFTSDTCERGTYVFFDYETGWGKRVKKDFTFEYSSLEDELRV